MHAVRLETEMPRNRLITNLKLRARELWQQDLVRKFLPALFVRGFGAAAGICVSFLVARSVSPAEAGLFFIGFALIQTGGRIVSLGAPEMTMRVVGSHYKTNWDVVNHNVKRDHEASRDDWCDRR